VIDERHPLALLAEELGAGRFGVLVPLDELSFRLSAKPRASGFRSYLAPPPGMVEDWCQDGLIAAVGEFILHLSRDAAGAWYARIGADWHGLALPSAAVQSATGECLATLRRLGSLLKAPMGYQALQPVGGGSMLFSGEVLLSDGGGCDPEDETTRLARLYLDDDRFRIAWYADRAENALWQALRQGTLQPVPDRRSRGGPKLKQWMVVPTTVPERELRVVPWVRKETEEAGEEEWTTARRRRRQASD